jgi:maltose O-acetyltransferase
MASLVGSSSHRWLRAADWLGPGARLEGKPYIANGGSIAIGERFHFGSTPVQSHLYTINGGKLLIGNRVTISYGAAIAAACELVIGDDTAIGPYVVIMDTDFHGVQDRDGPGEMTPVNIGKRVMIGARVTILRGAVIGDDAVIESGSVVSGEVTAGTRVRGVPARPVLELADAGNIDLPELVQEVLGLVAAPGMADGPDTLVEWDSLGALRLLLAVEDAYGVSLGEQDMKRARSVGELEAVIGEARRRSSTG